MSAFPLHNSDYDPYELADELLGRCGKLLSGSKIAPENKQVVWNANIILGGRAKIWYGDISLTDSADKLQELADKLEATIFVLREMDARFEYEKNPRIENAVKIFEPVS